MLKILQARLQQYMNHELPDVQAAFRKGKGTRDQIANIHWVIKKASILVKENSMWVGRVFVAVDDLLLKQKELKEKSTGDERC